MTYDRKRVYSWALYDWANSAYATTVMAGFFPVFFEEYWSAYPDSTTDIFRVGMANSIASLVIVALAPVLGAFADTGGMRKKFLFSFAALGLLSTGALSLVAQGQWVLALVLFSFGTIGFSGAHIFYDALIVVVAPKKELDYVSALGFAVGYLGGGILFAINILMTKYPETFGLADSSQAVRISFVTVAVWWAVFSIPIFLFVKEPKAAQKVEVRGVVLGGFRQLRDTFREVRKLRTVFVFLLGYWFYIDGVDTIVRMASIYGLSIGFDPEDLLIALLLVQFVGFPAAIAFGHLGKRIGTKRAIFGGLFVYIGITIFAFFMDQTEEFYVLAIVVGLVQGGVQSLSRSMYARLIPHSKAAEFFGFYNMLGKFAAVIGPALMGIVGKLTGDPRLSILSIISLFIVGAGFLYMVDEKAGEAAARELD
jgi:UMF1 family MFS transporter